MGYKMTKSAEEKISLRGPSSRAKKAKVVFDPSENNVPKKRKSENKKSGTEQTIREDLKYEPISYGRPIHKVRTVPTSPPEVAVPKKYLNFLCMICMKNISKYEKCVQCKSCNHKSHTICLEKANKHGLISLLQQNWECANCLTCFVCLETADMGVLYTCNHCRSSYHAICHNPRINCDTINTHKWCCSVCLDIDPSIKNCSIKTGKRRASSARRSLPSMVNDCSSAASSISSGSVSADRKRKRMSDVATTSKILPRVAIKEEPSCSKSFMNNTSSPCTSANAVFENTNWIKTEVDDDDEDDRGDLKKSEIEIDEAIPDVKKWSCDDVFNYFYKIHPDHADVLREQEIDGHSLLLLRRTDIIKGFSLKLGPAINIYRTIVKLQTRCNDQTQTWM